MQKINMLAKPKFGKTNKRNNYLYGEIEKNDNCNIYDFSLFNLLFKKFDGFHYHWPDRVLIGNPVKVAVKLMLLWLLFKLIRIKKAKSIYTCHNPAVKYKVRNKFVHVYYRVIRDATDAIIFPSPQSEMVFFEQLNNLKLDFRGHKAVIPLGLQTDLASVKAIRPRELGQRTKDYLLLVGRISEDKRFDSTVSKLLTYSNFQGVEIVVAGLGKDEPQVNNLEVMQNGSSLVSLINRKLADGEVNYLIQNCKGVVIDYKAINSGVATLTAALGKVILCSDEEFITSFKSQYHYEKIFSLEDVPFPSVDEQSDLNFDGAMSMMEVSEKTYDFYKQVLSDNV
ncbi:hypothetical protein N8837_01090 [Pseudomonadales bacterium]|nr:hypothetical protein [Pseudomonadales bacterium]